MRKWFPALALVAVVTLVFLLFRGKDRRSVDQAGAIQSNSSLLTNPIRVASPQSTGTNPFAGNAIALSAADAERKRQAFMRAKIASVPLPTMPEITNIPPQVVMENMRSVFQQYATRFGANPVGTNPEITAALNGRNPKQVVFIKPDDGLRLSDAGELVDNWGTPFFFHQLSACEMEIHSAGSDRVMWTADDLVIK